MRRLIFAGLALATLGACQTATRELTEEELSAIGDSVRQELVGFRDSWDTLDPQQHLAYYSDDAWWGTNGQFLVGEGFRAGTAAYMALFSEYEQEWDQIDVQVLSPDVVVTALTVNFSTVNQAGESGEGVESMTLVWSRIGGEWKVVHGHGSVQQISPA